MKQNKDRDEFEKILFNFCTFYEELPQTVRGRKRALKEMDKLWKMFQSYTQKKVEEAYKKGVKDEIECVENSGEHLDLQKKLSLHEVETK